jgi:hypothetical protein
MESPGVCRQAGPQLRPIERLEGQQTAKHWLAANNSWHDEDSGLSRYPYYSRQLILDLYGKTVGTGFSHRPVETVLEEILILK